MILKNSAIIASFSVISILLGIVRDRLLSNFVGVGATLDIYNASFRIPDLILGIMISFAGALTVIPFISKAINNNDKKDLEERFSSLFIFFGGVMILLAILIIIFIPYFAHIFVPGFTNEQIILFIFYTRILMIQPILLGLSALVSTIAQARHQFLLYGSAPLIYTTSIILSILFGYKIYGLIAIIFGVIFGSICHLLLQSLTIYNNSVKVSFSSFKWSLIKEQLSVSIPRSMSQVVSQLRTVFLTGFATTFGPGALSIYIFAQRVSDAVIQIISQSSATASLPLLSSQYSHGDLISYKKTFKKNIYIIFSITTLASILCMSFSEFVIYILYGNVYGAKDISNLLIILSIGFPFYALNTYFVTAFHAMKDSQTSLITNILTTIIAVISCFMFKESGFGLASVGYGTLVVGIFYTLISLLFFINKKHILK